MRLRQKPHPDTAAVLRECARRLDRPTRRLFLRQAAGFGTLTLLTGCDVVDDLSAEAALRRVSDFNDRVQAWLFDPRRLAREYPQSAITRPFPFNAFYPEGRSPEVDPSEYVLELAGRVADPQPWTLDRLYALPQRHAGHAPHLHRGLERDRQMERRAASRSSCPRRRRHDGAVRRVPLRGWLRDEPRHADRPAPANPADVLVRREVLPPQVRFPDEAARADEARLQEPEAHRGDRASTTNTPAAIGKTTATTGSAACELSFPRDNSSSVAIRSDRRRSRSRRCRSRPRRGRGGSRSSGRCAGPRGRTSGRW